MQDVCRFISLLLCKGSLLKPANVQMNSVSQTNLKGRIQYEKQFQSNILKVSSGASSRTFVS